MDQSSGHMHVDQSSAAVLAWGAKPAKGDAPPTRSVLCRVAQLIGGEVEAAEVDAVAVREVGCPVEVAARRSQGGGRLPHCCSLDLHALAPVASRLVFPQFEAQVRNKSQLRDAAVLGVDAVAVRDVELCVRGNLHRHHIVELGMGTRR